MPVIKFETKEKYRYQNGFNCYLEWVSQKAPYGLYAEKLSGTAFTAPRNENKQTWLYRVLLSCAHPLYQYDADTKNDYDKAKHLDFTTGLRLVAGTGDPTFKEGLGMYIYAAGKSMDEKTVFYLADGDLLIVSQEGVLDIRTEIGWLLIRSMEIALIPRGGNEEFGATASEGSNSYTVVVKFNNTLFKTVQPHMHFDVVAWHGNYYPFKYDLGRFNTIGTISFDHPDPSIFTVLTAPTNTPGTAVADFAIFPPRWLTGEDTFRPPLYHRNTMSEFMGLICGGYDAKRGGWGGGGCPGARACITS
ncbi:hypothetical protein NW755_014401 [Fusarium falciforme]|uniref:homogentisate 1,2-dioxygenase n=1 Tax=Fusarium falciforme TaxID=195108 RepID=A0A9W8QSS0_9HYPO|nr:hypothetical protein NW755_014401 [Fusarium falciforme]